MTIEASATAGVLVHYGRVLPLCCSLLLIGCSSDRLPTYPVDGRVVFPDGTPVRTGVLELKSVEHGLNARGQIARDGSFQLGTYTLADGAVAGKHQAIVTQFFAADSGPKIEHDHGDPVDTKFASYRTSQLEYTIHPRSNELEVLVDRPKSN